MPDDPINFKVLLVEDEDMDARMLCKLAEKATIGRLEIVRSKSLGDAVECLQKPGHGFQAMLCDLGLPDAEGTDAVLALQADCPAIPIVVLTGQRSLKTAIKSIEDGAQDCLFKGELSPDGLLRSLSYAVERHRQRRELWARMDTCAVPGSNSNSARKMPVQT